MENSLLEQPIEESTKGTYVTQQARKLQAEASFATYMVKGTLFNIHGDWAKREMQFNGTVWHVVDKEIGAEETQRGDFESSLQSGKQTETKKTRTITKEAHCFPRENGKPVIPLGGPRGYVCGMFRAAARTRGWNKKGNKYFGALSFIDNGGFLVTPQWFKVQSDVEVKLRPFFVKEAKGEVFFEYIEEVPIDFAVSVMKNAMPEDMPLQLLGDLERLPIGPKRRGTLKLTSIQKI
jgi:hypothetical protein